MVGFKTVWPLIFLLTLLSCIPQKKQTRCSSNEAFSASLRTCVPVIGGPQSFVKIDTFTPTDPLVKYKGDTDIVSFTLTISNPYAQTYDVEWIRTFQGNRTELSTATDLEYSLIPSSLSSEVGVHIITAKVVVGGTIVDSHNFELRISNNPVPYIKSIDPEDYAVELTPDAADTRTFEIDIANNGATIAGAAYETEWKLSRSGVNIPIDCGPDPFSSEVSTAIHSSTCEFDPSDTAMLGANPVGSYMLRAKVQSTAGATIVVDEKAWSISINHPEKDIIIGRPFYATVSGVSLGASGTLAAYDGVAYDTYTNYNFVPSTTPNSTATEQADFCVQFTSGEGTYQGGGTVRVDWFLDGVSMVHSASTTDDEICLSEGGATVWSNIVFSNTASGTSQLHTITARVVDEDTGLEYTTSDMTPSIASLGYPISWKVLVKPVNAAPKAEHGAISVVTCSNASGTIRNNCTVTSDQNFDVSLKFLSDDFYTVALNEGNILHRCRLYEDGVLISTVTDTDNSGAEYTCPFTIPSYNASGPIPVHLKTYQIQAEIYDDGSPLSSSGAFSSTYTWNFPIGSVIEKNSAPSIANEAVTGAVAEGAALTFSADVSDAERDSFSYIVQYCYNVGCTTTGVLTSGTVTKTSDVNPYPFSASVTLPEDFLHKFTGLGHNLLLRNVAGAVGFRLVVTDLPSNTSVAPIPTAYSDTSTIQSSNITNTNPAPALDVTYSTPQPSVFTTGNYFALVGVPVGITNNVNSILSDASGVTSEDENAFRYQWYAKNNTSVMAWTPIPGANSYNLIWSPSLITAANLGTDNPIQFILCVSDYPVSVPMAQATSVCNTALPWEITVHNNSTKQLTTDTARTDTHPGTEMATWSEASTNLYGSLVGAQAIYTAIIGNDKRIYVKKTIVKTDGGIDTIDSNEWAYFNALPGGAVVHTVKNLSITGVANDSLYVAYLASENISPNSFYPQVRRIDISQLKTITNRHRGVIGFDYDGLGIDLSACNAGLSANGGLINCTDPAVTSGVSSITFAGSANSGDTFSITTARGTITITFAVSTNVSLLTLCSSCSAATMATDFANIINSSTDYRLAGVFASDAGAVVTLGGSEADDFFDGRGLPHVADQAGRIYVHGGSWYLPFIDSSLGGSNNDKLSIYTAAVGAVMGDPSLDPVDPFDVGNNLSSMESISHFDNFYESSGGGALYVAAVSKTGSTGYLYKMNPALFTFDSTTEKKQIMTSDVHLEFKVAASSSYIFVGSKVASSKINLGIYNTSLAPQAEFDITNAANVEAGTDTSDIFNFTAMAYSVSSINQLNYEIIPYGSEARIITVADENNTNDYHVYMARLRSVNGTWTLSCGDCEMLSFQGGYVSPYVSLGVSPVNDKTAPSTAMNALSSGTLGTRNVVFMGYVEMDAAIGSATTSNPYISVINVEGEGIDATSLPTGDTGLFSPPFVKN